MNLHHWKIEIDEETPPSISGALLEIRTIRPRNVARISFSEAFWQKPYEEQIERLRHELLHLVLDPLWEEHEFQIKQLAPVTEIRHYRERFVRHLERAVEHLARMPAFAAQGNLY